MKITVTTKDIEEGRRRDPSDCPVARALRRAGISHFGVTGMLVIVQEGRNHLPVVLPAGVQDWILDFDWGSTVAPIDFELAVPEEKEIGRAHLPPRERASEKNGSKRSDEAVLQPDFSESHAVWPDTPRWNASAKGLLAHGWRNCQRRHKARGRVLAEEVETLAA
jgi:hypothetical protein